MSARGLGVVSVLVGVLVCLAVSCSSAFAKVGYIQVGSFAPSEAGFGQAYGVGVDNSAGLSKGDVYVSDRGSSTVYEFSSAGLLLGQASVPGVTLGQLSVAEAGAFAGYVYVAGESNGVVYRFAPGLGSSEELVTGLQSPSDVTVDAAGDLFVSEALVLKVLEFNSSGQPVNASGTVVGASENTVANAELFPPSPGQTEELTAVAVDAAGTSLYVSGTDTGSHDFGETIKYALSGGAYVSAGPFGVASIDLGATVASSGDVYIDEFGEVFVYEPSGALIGKTPQASYFFSARGVSVSGETGDLYLASSRIPPTSVVVFEGGQKPAVPTTEADSGLVGSFVTLNGSLAGGETGYYFEYKKGPSCAGGVKTPLVAASGAQQVHVELRELARLSQYSYCLVAVDKYGVESGSSVSFEVGQVQPRVLGESVSSVATRTATVSAQIDPEGSATGYYFEYGRGVSYESRTAQFSAGAGEAPVSVTASLTGLDPGASYHVRVVAVDGVGSNQGADISFATYAATPAGLPDGRVYEMVSPAFNPYDSEVYETTAGLLKTATPFEAAADGNAVVYAGLPGAGGTGSSGSEAEGTVGEQYRATRSAQGGWTQTNVTPTGVGIKNHYVGFSSDLSAGVVPAFPEPPFQATTAISQPISYGYKEFYEINFGEGVFRPFFTTVPPNRRPVATEISNAFAAQYAGASGSFTSYIFQANDALLEGTGEAERELAAATKKEGEIGKEIVKLEAEEYAINHKRAEVESKPPEPGQEIVREEEIARLRAEEGELRQEIRSRIPASDHNELYVFSGGRVSLVNVLPDGKLAVGATFGDQFPQTDGGSNKNLGGVISADGSRIFWTSPKVEPGLYVRVDGSRTLEVSGGHAFATYWGASANGRYAYYAEEGNLWRFDVDSDTREELTGPEAYVRGVIGVNQTGEEGAYVYFMTEGVLTGSEENAEKQAPTREEGAENLYVSEPDPAHPGQHVTRFIAPLGSVDENDWSHPMGERTAGVAPDGRSVVFMAGENLTGHPYSNEGSSEVYDYRVSDARLFCVSCRPQATGGRLTPSASLVFMRRWVSEDGDRVFFESEAPLVLNDVNGARDVYEWELDGTGTCIEVEGCVYLISGGLEATAFFADASMNGSDVFIATRQRLVPEDQNEMADLYDARVNGVRTVTPPACTGTGCQGAPASPPIFATPSSLTFNGVGNFEPPPPVAPAAKAKGLRHSQRLARALAACHRKKRKRQRALCEARAHRSYGARSAGKRASATRRAG
jgi:hypothetical protein